MVVLNKIYTRTGDAGTTGLASGTRVSKTDVRVEAYGTVDELNAVIGVARLHSGQNDRIDAMLARIQNELFDLGADLATPLDPPPKWEALRIVASQIDRLEAEIDWMNESLKALDSFILPGGSPLATYLHLARTVARRAERDAIRLVETGTPVTHEALRYLNRLSDHLFVAARRANRNGADDVKWVPGGTR
ncbi:cob(I)yrinic acid a,c-diamide adenosyltransferase [Brevundimonas goettingensis]|uniref:Corrinoid adenosyltransferase n=1 Tax=Brevundimonas goettingensis TaxID=2774190 RepID=A0A975BZ59_9CAUL|nr:cob(I)yrinic acid a,c-diamide adenosyltransferase [Brevundimonas goettingensis]QTC90493.1 cob(I)yrinic acid a,c-diamide adenosyltransferase [Brevundimonas goettingensis]